MGYIYCITNIINNKRYIGKTTVPIKERWHKHCKCAQGIEHKTLPLYVAMRNYGIENFKIEQIEYIEDDKLLSQREKHWIKELNTFGDNGYNASEGGEGVCLFDHSEMIYLYRLGYSVKQISEKLNCDSSTVSRILRANGIKSRGHSKMIDQFDLAGNYIQSFDSTKDAEKWLHENSITKSKTAHVEVRDCCQGKAKTRYGYIWKYKEIPEL